MTAAVAVGIVADSKAQLAIVLAVVSRHHAAIALSIYQVVHVSQTQPSNRLGVVAAT